MTSDVDWRVEFEVKKDEEELPACGAVLSELGVMKLAKLDVGPLYVKLGLVTER
jgi:hypothetical protein